MRTIAFACVLLLAGCASHREAIVVPPIHVTVDSDPSRRTNGENPFAAAIAKVALAPYTKALGQMIVGCQFFFHENGRWPRSKDEVIMGLARANLPRTSLDNLELSLREDHTTLIIDFVSADDGRMHGTISLTPKDA